MTIYRHILETPASEKEFQENLHELDHKLNFVKEQEFREIAAVVDVQKDVIKLKMKVKIYLVKIYRNYCYFKYTSKSCEFNEVYCSVYVCVHFRLSVRLGNFWYTRFTSSENQWPTTRWAKISCLTTGPDLQYIYVIAIVFYVIFRYFNEFLMAHSRPTALEIQTEYVDTMSKIYYSYFKDYHAKLMKLQVSKPL